MLLKPNVNVSNIMALADFIRDEGFYWNYEGCTSCFIGATCQLLDVEQQAPNGVWVDGKDALSNDITIVANFLGLDYDQAEYLCLELFESFNNFDLLGCLEGPNRAEAVAILNELATTGRLPS